MTTSVKRFLGFLIVAVLLVAALGMASVGASPSAAPSVRGVAAPQVAPPPAQAGSIDSWLVDLADPKEGIDPACAGWLLGYTLTFTNTSGEPLSGLVLSDTIPANAEFRESRDGGVFNGTDTIVWDLPEIAPDQVVTRQFVIRPFTSIPAGTIITDTAAVVVQNLVIENSEEGTTIQRCAEPTHTPTPTQPSPTAMPTDTATPEPPTPTPTVIPEGGKTIWLPIIMNQFER